MTYTTTTDDIDKSIKVTASFTDDDGYSETRTSNPVGPITAQTCVAPDLGGRVEVWSATLTVEQLFTGPLEAGYGYRENIGGELSNPSFELDGETVTIKELRDLGGRILFEVDVDVDLLPHTREPATPFL